MCIVSMVGSNFLSSEPWSSLELEVRHYAKTLITTWARAF